MSLAWHDLVGAVGVAAIVGAYLLLTLEKLSSRGRLYPAANAVGAALILLSLAYDFNLSAALVEGFWLVVSLIGLARSGAKPSG